MSEKELDELFENPNAVLTKSELIKWYEWHRDLYKNRAYEALEKGDKERFNKYKGYFYAMVRALVLVRLLGGNRAEIKPNSRKGSKGIVWECEGLKKTGRQWALFFGVNYKTFNKKLNKYGVDAIRAEFAKRGNR